MAETTNSILEKLDGLESRFEEVSTLITDPAVIGDQQRFVKLTKEYKDLSDIMDARKRYIACLNGIKEAKDICNAGDLGLIPGSGRYPGEGNGNPLQYACLENPMDRGAWQAAVHGVPRVRHVLATIPPF